MAGFVFVSSVFSVLLCSYAVQSESLFEIIFTSMSDKLESIEAKLDQSVVMINERLDRLEKIVENKEEFQVDEVGSGPNNVNEKNGNANLADFESTKRRFLKALMDEKQFVRDFTRSFEARFETFKQSVVETLLQMNESIIESKQKIDEVKEQTKNATTMVENLETKVEKELSSISSKIDAVRKNATLENDDMESRLQNSDDVVGAVVIKQSQIESKITSLENQVSLANRQSASDAASLASVASMKRELESSVRSLASRVSSLDSSTDSRISSVLTRISALEETKEGFSAFLTSSRPYSQYEVIVFDGTVYTHGSGYSTRTGKFTAPKTGTYLFSFSVEGDEKFRAYGQFIAYENGVKSIRGQARSLSSLIQAHVTASNTVVYYLLKGEQVWVRAGSTGDFVGSRTSFAGVLLD